MTSEYNPDTEEGRKPERSRQAEAEDDARPITGEPVAPLRLRLEPPRVTRLSRRVLIGLGAAGSLAISGVLYYGLQTRNGSQGQELYSTDNRSTPDGLNGLPKDYSGVPKLGPPLPGDLGSPILNAQNAGQPVLAPGIAAPNAGRSGRRRRNSGGRRSWRRRGSPSSSLRPKRGLPAAVRQCRQCRPRRRRPTSAVSAGAAAGDAFRAGTGSSPSSTRPPTSAPWRPIASSHPHRRTCCRPAR